MGAWLCHMSCIPTLSTKPHPIDVIIAGLADAGKTTILNKLTYPNGLENSARSAQVVIPTIGFNTETIKCKPSPDREGNADRFLRFWDLGSVIIMEKLWKEYLAFAEAVVFVVDSQACTSSVNAALTRNAIEHFVELMARTEHDNLPIYVMANKQDLPKALTPAEIVSELNLEETLAEKTWMVGGTSATDGSGLQEAMNWLIENTDNYDRAHRIFRRMWK